jgi:hypothetical protein
MVMVSHKKDYMKLSSKNLIYSTGTKMTILYNIIMKTWYRNYKNIKTIMVTTGTVSQ